MMFLREYAESSAGQKAFNDLLEKKEGKVKALRELAAQELASMPPSSQRLTIIIQMGAFLSWLVDQADDAPRPPTISREDLEELAEHGIATAFDLGPYDTDKPH